MSRPTLNDVYDPLLRAIEGVDLATAPVVLIVRCGVDRGRGRVCDGRIGTVVAVPAGLVWLPHIAAITEPAPPGSVPFLLPPSTPQERSWRCETLHSTCSSGHHWSLAAGELKRRAYDKRPYYVKRIVQAEWGPQVEDPRRWTDQDLADAIAAVKLIANDEEPPGTPPTARASKAAERASVLIDMVEGRGEYVDFLPALLDRVSAGIHLR